MAQYQYKVVPFIGSIKGNQGADAVAQQLSDAINQYAADGWEFHQMGDVNIRINPGCLASFFGASA
jgi:hypothetical protein